MRTLFASLLPGISLRAFAAGEERTNWQPVLLPLPLPPATFTFNSENLEKLCTAGVLGLTRIHTRV